MSAEWSLKLPRPWLPRPFPFPGHPLHVQAQRPGHPVIIGVSCPHQMHPVEQFSIPPPSSLASRISEGGPMALLCPASLTSPRGCGRLATLCSKLLLLPLHVCAHWRARSSWKRSVSELLRCPVTQNALPSRGNINHALATRSPEYVCILSDSPGYPTPLKFYDKIARAAYFEHTRPILFHGKGVEQETFHESGRFV